MKPTITPEQVREWIAEEDAKEDIYAFSELQDCAVQLAQSWLRQAEALEVARRLLGIAYPAARKLRIMRQFKQPQGPRFETDALIEIEDDISQALTRIDAIMKEGE